MKPCFSFLAALVVAACDAHSVSPNQTRSAEVPPAAGPGIAADWAMHRGDPQLQGRASEPAPKQPELRWTFNAGKPVKGGAAIAGGRAYFGDDAGVVHCVKLADGKPVWRFETEGAIEATPLVMDGRVFIGASNGKLYALDAATGEKKWEFETADKILASASWARDPVSGAKWVLVGSYDFNFYALDALTGKEQWKVETENFINSTPAVTPDGFALFGGCDALLHVVSLKDRKEVRAINAEAYIPGSAAADGKMVYLGNDAKKVFAFEIETGATLWSFRDRNFPYFSSPALSEKDVIIGGRDKRVHCIDRATGDRRWYFATRGDVDSSPVLCSDGGIVVGSHDGRLYCLELADGKERWNYDVGAKISGSPAIANGVIVIGAEDGNVYCFGGKK
jgi:eukaryotic-like serine/threonine-protein kinase